MNTNSTSARPRQGPSARRSHGHRWWLAGCMAGLLMGPGGAQASTGSAAELSQLSLDTLLNLPVSGASRLPQRMSDTAASVTVIDAADIRALGAQTLAEVLATVRGIAISSDRTYHYAGVRGLLAGGDLNTRVLLLIDGNRVNDVVYDQAFLGDEFPLDLSEVARIEFIPGQGSAVHGANALSGVINVITRSARDGDAAAQAGVQAGSGRRRQAHAAWHGAFGAGALRLAVSRTLSDGTPIAFGDRWADGVDGLRRTALRLRYEQGPWTLAWLHADREKQLPLYPGVVFGDPRNVYRDTQSLLNLEHRRRLDDGTDLTARLWAGRYRFTGDYVYEGAPPTLNRDEAEGRWWGAELRSVHRLSAGHQLTLGGELQQVPTLLQTNDDVAPVAARTLDERCHDSRWAVFAEDQLQLDRRWSASLGGRVDYHRDGPLRLSPRASLIYQAAPRWVLKAIAGAAYRPPNAYEAHYAVPGPSGYTVDPTLRAERMRGTELAVEGWPTGSTRVAGSLYRNRMSGLIAQTYDPVTDQFSFRNVGSLVSRGAEAEVETRWASGQRLRASLGWQVTDSDGSTASTGQFPRDMAKLAWIVPLPARAQFGLEGQAMSRRDEAPGQAVLHAALSSADERSGPWRWGVAVRNLTGRRLIEPGWSRTDMATVPQPGRQWRFSLERDL